MDGNSITKFVGILIIIIVGTFLWLGDFFDFFIFKGKDRWYWLRLWVTISIIFGILFWIILIFFVNDNFK